MNYIERKTRHEIKVHIFLSYKEVTHDPSKNFPGGSWCCFQCFAIADASWEREGMFKGIYKGFPWHKEKTKKKEEGISVYI